MQKCDDCSLNSFGDVRGRTGRRRRESKDWEEKHSVKRGQDEGESGRSLEGGTRTGSWSCEAPGPCAHPPAAGPGSHAHLLRRHRSLPRCVWRREAHGADKAAVPH